MPDKRPCDDAALPSAKQPRLWGTALHQPTPRRQRASMCRRAHMIECDSDSDAEEAVRLVAAHYEDEEESKQADPRALLDLYTTEEIVAWRAERRRRARDARARGDGGAAEGCEEPLREDYTEYEREMGHAIEPFHMGHEHATGHFAADGFWIRNKTDPTTDAWLHSLDELQVRPVRGAQAPPRPPPRAAAEGPASEHFATLLTLVRPGETVARALRRLKGPRDAPAEGAGPAAATASDFQRLMEASDRLLGAGVYNVCDSAREELAGLAAQAEAQEAARAEAEARAAKQRVLWEYTWSGTEPGAAVHGPFPARRMQEWKEHGFFTAARRAYARPVPQDMFALEEPEWQEAHVVDFLA